jgi:hypothetical protein
VSQEEDDQKHIAFFEEQGVAGVQALMSQNALKGRRWALAGKWLDQKAAETRAEEAALQRRGVEASETQAGEARKATRIALWSLGTAVIALIVAAFALVNDMNADTPTPQPAAATPQPAAATPPAG